MRNDELYHHGVKGMQWGVRKKHESSENNKSKRKGLTGKQKRAIAIGAAAVATGLAVYGAYKLSNSRYFDRQIKVGKDFYRQGHKNEASEGLNELIYATFKKQDSAKYAANSAVGDVGYKIKNTTTTKIAGTRSAEQIYKEVLKNNPEFRSHYGHMSYKDFNGSLGFANSTFIEQNKLFGRKLKDMYVSPFFDALAEKGYNAIVDTQDTFSKVPVILINSAGNYKIT